MWSASWSTGLRTGTPGQRKAIMETHIAGIQFDGDRLIPVYRIPVDEFRTRVRVVGRTLHHANHTIVLGNPLAGRLTSSRA